MQSLAGAAEVESPDGNYRSIFLLFLGALTYSGRLGQKQVEDLGGASFHCIPPAAKRLCDLVNVSRCIRISVFGRRQGSKTYFFQAVNIQPYNNYNNYKNNQNNVGVF